METPRHLGVDELVARGLYRVHGRGARVAVWDAATRCLVGFGYEHNTFTLTLEHHYDTAGRFGTGQPVEPVLLDGVPARLPTGTPLVETLGTDEHAVLVACPDLFEPLLELVTRVDETVARWAARRAEGRGHPNTAGP